MKNISSPTRKSRWSTIVLILIALTLAAEPLITHKSAPDGGTLLACLIIGFVALWTAQRRVRGNQ
jgi:hypothetical protein